MKKKIKRVLFYVLLSTLLLSLMSILVRIDDGAKPNPSSSKNDSISEELSSNIESSSEATSSSDEVLEQLEAPKNVEINETTLSFDEVANATSYGIYVDDNNIGTYVASNVSTQKISVLAVPDVGTTYTVCINGTNYSISGRSDSVASWEELQSKNTTFYTITNNQVIWKDGTIVQYNGLDVLPTDVVLNGISGYEYTTREATSEYILMFDNSIFTGDELVGYVKVNGTIVTSPYKLTENAKILFYGALGGTLLINDSSVEIESTIDLSNTNIVSNYTKSSIKFTPYGTIVEINYTNTSNVTTSKISVDLTTLSGWKDVAAGTHTINVVAIATGYKTSEKTNGITFTKANSGVLLEAGTYKWVDELSNPTNELNTDINFTCEGETTSFVHIQIEHQSLENRKVVMNYKYSYGETMYATDNKNGWDDHPLFQTITLLEDQYIDYDFYTYAIDGNQLVKQEAVNNVITAGTYKWVETPTNFEAIGGTVEEPTAGTAGFIIFSFTSNSTEWNALSVNYVTTSTNSIVTYAPPITTEFYNVNHGGWTDEAYRTMVIAEDQYIDADFYTYAITNGNLVKQEAASETWTLNDNVSTKVYYGVTAMPTASEVSELKYNFNVNFVSNGEDFIGLAGNSGGPDISGLPSTYLQVRYKVDGWVNDAYRTITFKDAPTGDLLTWLQTNGTKQEETSGNTLTLSGYDSQIVTGVVAPTLNGETITDEDCPITLKDGDVIKLYNGRQFTVNGVSYSIISEDRTITITGEDITISSSKPEKTLDGNYYTTIIYKKS